MAGKKQAEPPPPEPREFSSTDEIDHAIKKIERRIEELDRLDIRKAILEDNGSDDVVRSNIRETIREVFGGNSPEYREHKHIRLWAGPEYMGMSDTEIIEGTERGRNQARGILQGLMARLQEKREDLVTPGATQPSTYFDRLNLHPRIADVANDLFLD